MTRPRLTLSLCQRVHVGTEVRKALRLLQLPGIELQAEVQREIMENPCLEIDDEGEGGLPDWGVAKGDRLYGTHRPDQLWEEWTSREIPAPPEGLRPHLRRQVALSSALDPSLRQAAEYWVENIDDRGYVHGTAGEVAAALGLDERQATAALAFVQSLDPPGVGAAGLRDSLRLQLERLHPEARLARRIVEEAWHLVPRGLAPLALHLGETVDEVRAAIRVLSRLSPRPGHEFDPEPVRAVWPDVLVRELDGEFVVSMDEAVQPRVRWAPAFAEYQSSTDPEVSRFLFEKRRSARWILRALQRRRRSLVLVAEAIVACQEPFFREGPEALRPLTLKDIGSTVGLHESTVARVTQDKYADTPRGILPLRYFFSGRVRKAGHEDVAARAVKERIRELIREEEDGKPISDQRIAELLTYEGIRIARRTVAKYRDQLGIPRAQLRGLAVPAA
ncbi:MAG: RNA polymerase factor sigma-54 [Candidatus Eisenbacteria bacterium]